MMMIGCSLRRITCRQMAAFARKKDTDKDSGSENYVRETVESNIATTQLRRNIDRSQPSSMTSISRRESALPSPSITTRSATLS